MKVDDFVNLVNSMNCEKFSDVPENDVELVQPGVFEKWSNDYTYITSMKVYRCEGGYAGVTGVSHIERSYFDRYQYMPSHMIPKLPRCFAVKVETTVKASYLRKEFPMHHDTKFRLYVKEKLTGEILCDELFDTHDEVDKRESELFAWQYNSEIEKADRINGKPPKYDDRRYYINIYRPISSYEDSVIDWNA